MYVDAHVRSSSVRGPHVEGRRVFVRIGGPRPRPAGARSSKRRVRCENISDAQQDQ